jgi:hypothetical protein
MTDIVERARLAAAPGGWARANQELLIQLAAEIERLREALKQMVEISERNSEASMMFTAIRMCAQHALRQKGTGEEWRGK